MIAPWRMDEFREQFPGRAEMIAYAEKHNIPVQASAEKPYSMDRNLLHISFESGMLEDPWFDRKRRRERGYVSCSAFHRKMRRIKPEYVELEFEQGNCVGD